MRHTIINICMLFYFLLFTNFLVSKQYKTVFLYGYTMGTTWKVKLINNKNYTNHYLVKKIEKQLDYDNNQISSWNKQSSISRFNNNFTTKPQKINKNLANLISICLFIGKKTHGLLDITSGNLINLWGFGPKTRQNKLPSQKEIEIAKKLTGLAHIKLIKRKGKFYLKKNIPKLQINLSTIGEGFAADNLGKILKKEGIKDYIISVGGAIITHEVHNHPNPKIVAIQKPEKLGKNIHLIVSLRNSGISTSGTYRNYYIIQKKISHLIDPITGKSSNTDLISASVISTSALKSDAWDTGLMLLGFKKAKEIVIKEKLAACLIIKKQSKLFTWISPKFKKFLIKSTKHF